MASLMTWTDSPERDAEDYYDELEERLEQLPQCSECGEHIQDDYAYYINELWICEKCMNENYKKEVLE